MEELNGRMKYKDGLAKDVKVWNGRMKWKNERKEWVIIECPTIPAYTNRESGEIRLCLFRQRNEQQ